MKQQCTEDMGHDPKNKKDQMDQDHQNIKNSSIDQQIRNQTKSLNEKAW